MMHHQDSQCASHRNFVRGSGRSPSCRPSPTLWLWDFEYCDPCYTIAGFLVPADSKKEIPWGDLGGRLVGVCSQLDLLAVERSGAAVQGLQRGNLEM